MNNQKRNIQILISSDCHGRFEEIVSKVSSLQLKQSFDLMILTGEVCHPRSSSFIQAIRNQNIEIPVPMYFIDDSSLSPLLHKLHPHGLSIAKNLNFLGSRGIIKVQGIVIAYFSHNAGWDGNPPSSEQIQQFLNMCRGRRVDILLTNRWSREIKQISGRLNAKCEDYVGTLASQVNPHYHIAAGGDSFYRMSPYANQNHLLTHFISVAPFTENTKEKYLFGLTIRPELEELPKGDDFLENPYRSLLEKQDNQQKERVNISLKTKIRQTKSAAQSIPINSAQTMIYFEGFPDWARDSDITEFLQRWGDLRSVQCKKGLVKGSRCGYVKFRTTQSLRSCQQSSQKVFFHSKRIKFSRVAEYQKKRQESCWFCKEGGDEQLIIYKGKYCYVSLEKGPISRFHMQMIPYNHVENSGKLEIAEREELDHILTIIKNHFVGKGYEVVTYQRYLPLSQSINHCVLHFIPFKPSAQASLESKFEKLNINDQLGFRVDRGDRRSTQHYIKLSINGQFFIKQIGKKERIQADFMRVIMGQVIGKARVGNWKQCERGEGELLLERRDVLLQLKQSGLII